MPARRPARVTIAQAIVPHYRLALFELLHERLAHEGVELQVVYGDPNREQAAKGDLVELPAPAGLKVRNLWLAGKLLHQPVLRQMMGADLAILPNAAGYLPNYLFWLAARRSTPKLGFWVYHTRQRMQDGTLKEAVSRRMMRRGDWWFAYTGGTRDYLLMNGASEERITVLNNSVDVTAFRAALASVHEADLEQFAARHGIPRGAPVALFCGGLHRDKRLEFLFEAVRLIHERCPDFRLIVVGDGSCRDVVQRAATGDPRIRYLGTAFGREKALCFRLAEVFVCPGLVGLGILDAFAAGLPLVTTDLPIHSPEIDYLRHGINGWVTAHDPRVYADAAVMLLTSQVRLRSLGQAALADAAHYSIEGMAQRFSQGIRACLACTSACS